MGNIKSLCVRFNLAKNNDKTVWDILHSLDKKKWKSVNRTVITAVKDFFERNSRLESDPYFETREREEKFTADIISAVERSMDKEIPKYFAVCIGEIFKQYTNGSSPAPAASAVVSEKAIPTSGNENHSDNSDIDLDFLCQ